MLLTIRQLQVKYGNQTALQIDGPISFEKGERIGVIGSNGAGKTTLVKAILGLTNCEGRIITDLKPEQMAAHMQSNAYVTTMPVRRIMEMVLDTRIKENKELQELIAFFEFEECLSRRFSVLSGGQKQKFTIIMRSWSSWRIRYFCWTGDGSSLLAGRMSCSGHIAETRFLFWIIIR